MASSVISPSIHHTTVHMSVWCVRMFNILSYFPWSNVICRVFCLDIINKEGILLRAKLSSQSTSSGHHCLSNYGSKQTLVWCGYLMWHSEMKIVSGVSCLFNTLRPRQNGRYFPDDTFKRIFLNDNVRISIKISLKFVTKGPINNIPSLVKTMAWRRPGDKPLS